MKILVINVVEKKVVERKLEKVRLFRSSRSPLRYIISTASFFPLTTPFESDIQHAKPQSMNPVYPGETRSLEGAWEARSLVLAPIA